MVTQLGAASSFTTQFQTLDPDTHTAVSALLPEMTQVVDNALHRAFGSIM